MVYFQTKNSNLGKILRVLKWKIWLYFSTILNIFRSFGTIYGRLVYFSRFGMFGQRKIWQPWLKR
jgi:hypothetical protein